MSILKFPRQFFSAVHIEFIHLAPAVFELGKVRGIEIQFLRHGNLADGKSAAGSFQQFAFVKIS